MNAINPLVSILVPVYNVAKYIERCTVSLLEQTYDNIEYIFIDDCSTDNSVDILISTINKYPKRYSSVRIIKHTKNRGLAAARNTAIDYAKGSFVMHVDSDDYIDIHTVDHLLIKQAELDADIVCFDVCVYKHLYKEYYIHPNYQSPHEAVELIMKGKALHMLCSRLIRLSLYNDNHIRAHEGVNVCEDLHVTPRLIYYSRRITNLHEILYHYDCNNSNSYTSKPSLNKYKQICKAYDILFSFFKERDIQLHMLIHIHKLIGMINILKETSKWNEIELNRLYYIILRKIEKTDHEYWRKISLPDRIILYIRNKKLVHLYVKIAGFIKHQFILFH